MSTRRLFLPPAAAVRHGGVLLNSGRCLEFVTTGPPVRKTNTGARAKGDPRAFSACEQPQLTKSTPDELPKTVFS